MARGRNAGNRGQGSKWLSKKKRAAIYARDGHRCVWCGLTAIDVQLTVDHLIPRSRGGGNEANNLVTACMTCNRDLGDAPRSSVLSWCNADAVLERLLRAIDGAANVPGFGRRRQRPKLKAVA